MSNYKQSTVTGDSWVRAKRVVIENSLDGTPAITFIEEQVISTAQGIAPIKEVGCVCEPFDATNALEEFPVYHPETGVFLGSSTYQDAYVMLHNLYMHVAAKRDVDTSIYVVSAPNE